MNAVKVVRGRGAGRPGLGGCTPDWAKNGNCDVVLLMTAINDGTPLDSDVGSRAEPSAPTSVPAPAGESLQEPGRHGQLDSVTT